MSDSFETPWSVAHQSPLSMEVSRQESWSGLPFPPPETFETQGSNLHLLPWQVDFFFFTTELPGKPCKCLCQILNVLIYLVVTDCHEGKWYYYSPMNVKTQINKSKLAHLTNCGVAYQHESPNFLSLTACTLRGSLPPTTHPLCESTLCYFYLCDYSFVIFCEGFFSLPYSFLRFQHPFPVEGSHSSKKRSDKDAWACGGPGLSQKGVLD